MDKLIPSYTFEILECLAETPDFKLQKACRLPINDIVVCKSLLPSREKDEVLRRQFLQQAHAQMGLEHPHIRRIHQIIEEGKSVYVIEEYLDGKPLYEVLKSNLRLLNTQNVLDFAAQMLDALSYAHSKGIFHGQLSPEHIYLTSDNRIVIDGFGKPSAVYTNKDTYCGQFHPVYYLAPEQLHDDKLTASADIFATGVILYQLLTGRLPWNISDAHNPVLSKEKTVGQLILDPSLFNQQIPFWLFTVLRKSLQTVSLKRFATTADFLIALNNQKEISSYEPPVAAIPTPKPEPVKTPEAPVAPPKPEEKKPEPQPVKTEVPPAQQKDETPSFTSLLKDEEKPSHKVQAPAPETPVPPTMEEIINPHDEPALQEEKPQPKPEPVKEPARPAPQPKVETTKPEPQKPAPAVQKPAPAKTVATHTAHPHSKATHPHIPSIDEEEIKPVSKTFKIIATVSVVVILITIGKYYYQSRKLAFNNLKQDTTEVVATSEDSLPKVKNVAIDMLSLPGGAIVIGSMGGDAAPDEFPPWQITVPGFYMSKTEVTQKQWMMVNGSNPSGFVDLNAPVENVSFFDVVDYCNAKSDLDGYMPCYTFDNGNIICDFRANGYRLPTEAEWEYAAKAGNSDYPTLFSGSNIADSVAWYSANSNATTHPVARLLANKLGIYDLSGNAAEWVWNWYAPYSNPKNQALEGLDTGTERTIRGGSWQDSPTGIRCSARSHQKPWYKSNTTGFRVVRSL